MNVNLRELPILQGIAIGEQTTQGIPCHKYPLTHGNCFSLQCESPGHKPIYLRVLNFYLENLQELLRLGIVQWPIPVLKLGDDYGLLHDPRIAHEWYRVGFCGSCCGEKFLEPHQVLLNMRREATGDRIVHGDCVSERISATSRKLDKTWTAEFK